MSNLKEREISLQHFLREHGWQQAQRIKISGDASFRQYERLYLANRQPAILMDAPPPKERIDHFLKIAKILQAMEISVPEILAVDLQQGFIIMEDFGDNTYTRLLQTGYEEKKLYQLACDLLIHIRHHSDPPILAQLSPFDLNKVLREVQVFTEWYWPMIHKTPISATGLQEYVKIWQYIFQTTASPHQVLTHFDFHVDNLMLLPHKPGIKACGLLDFQDAVQGPAMFDLMSLIDDARRDVAQALGTQLIHRYQSAFPQDHREEFDANYALFAAQRHTRILGTFVRLFKRDAKPGYLQFIPRVWKQLESALEHPSLGPLKNWFTGHFPAKIRNNPLSLKA